MDAVARKVTRTKCIFGELLMKVDDDEALLKGCKPMKGHFHSKLRAAALTEVSLSYNALHLKHK